MNKHFLPYIIYNGNTWHDVKLKTIIVALKLISNNFSFVFFIFFFHSMFTCIFFGDLKWLFPPSPVDECWLRATWVMDGERQKCSWFEQIVTRRGWLIAMRVNLTHEPTSDATHCIQIVHTYARSNSIQYMWTIARDSARQSGIPFILNKKWNSKKKNSRMRGEWTIL